MRSTHGSLTRRTRAGTALAVAAVAVLAWGPGCILLVGGPENASLTECTFQGDDASACGMCVAKACVAPLDKCCTADSCKANLTFLDQCATGDSVSCSTLSSNLIDGPEGLFTALGACVAKNCPVCAGVPSGANDSGVPADGSNVSCSAPDNATGTCSCEVEENTVWSSVACSAAQFTNGICCQDANYPSAGSCTCGPYSCDVDSMGDCLCSSNYDPSSSQDPSECSGLNCCISDDGLCSCSETETCSGTPVETCSAANTGCDGNQFMVTACSP